MRSPVGFEVARGWVWCPGGLHPGCGGVGLPTGRCVPAAVSEWRNVSRVSAYEDRRTIERALHDGVQQDLIAVSVRLQLARQLAGGDLPAALALLNEIGVDVRDALGRVQGLANRIYPSVLDARGLVDALRGAASAAQVDATVEAAGLGRYPPDVEAAVYFSCRAALETLAPDARVTIRISEEEDAIRLEVIGDEGARFTATMPIREV
jgi:signal transduction histidine kinase